MDEKIKELEAMIAAQTEELTKLTKEAADLKLEKDSFAEENAKLKTAYEELKKENDDTKKLNFTLARSVSAGQRKSASDIMNEIF